MNRKDNRWCLFLLCIGACWSLAVCNAQSVESVDIDSDGRLHQFINKRGLSTTFHYDALDRPIEIRGTSGQARIGYDSVGRHAWTEGELGVVNYKYDALNRLRTVHYAINQSKEKRFIKILSYDYDDHGLVRSVTLSDPQKSNDYQVELVRDIAARLVYADIGGHIVKFSHRSGNGVLVTLRQLPNGIESRLTYSQLGLPTAISHRRNDGQTPLQQTSITYAMESGNVEFVDELSGKRTALNVSKNTLGLSDSAAAHYQLNADLTVLKMTSRKKDGWFINAPTGSGIGLTIELSQRGTPKSYFFVDAQLSVEHKVGHRPTFFLEDGRTDLHAPLYLRLATGQSLSFDTHKTRSGVSESLLANIPPALNNWAPRIDYTNKFANVLNGLSDLRRTYFNNNTDPKHVKVLPYLKYVNSLVNDADQMVNGRTSFEHKLIHHGLLGKTMETLVKEAAKTRVQPIVDALVNKKFNKTVARINVPGISEAGGLGFDVVRTRSFWSPDTMEHVLDLTLGAAVGGLTYVATAPLIASGNVPAHLRVTTAAAEFATKIPDIPRSMLKAKEVRFGDYMGRTGEDRTGDYMYQGANALLRGNAAYFQKHHGDIFDTVPRGRRAHRAAFITRAKADYDRFQIALSNGDRDGVAELLTTSRGIRRAMMKSGVSEKNIADMVHALGKARPQLPVPGHAIVEHQSRLGGVDLTVPTDGLLSIGRMEGAVYDEKEGRVVLYGDGELPGPAIDAELFATAVLFAYRDDLGDPKFSLDPVDPSNSSSWQKAVYIPNNVLSGTKAGNIMYLADLELKLLAFGASLEYGPWVEISDGGTNVQGPVEVWHSNLYQPINLGPRPSLMPGFKSIPELAQNMEMTDDSMRSRQWIVVEDVAITQSNSGIVFDKITLGVRAKRQVIGPDGQLVDVETDDPIATAFAKQLSGPNAFESAAEKIPPFRDLIEFVKALALAKWLAKNDVPIDLKWAVDTINQRAGGVREVSTLHWGRRQVDQSLIKTKAGVTLQSRISGIQISGGVNLAFRPAVTRDSRGTETHIHQTVLQSMHSNTQPTFPIEADRAPWATTLPINEAGRLSPENPKVWMNGAVRYLVDTSDRITTGTDAYGQHERYGWSDRGELTSLSTSGPTGRHTQIIGKDGSYTESLTSLANQRLEWKSENAGAMSLWNDAEVALKARLKKRDDSRTVVIDYPRANIVHEFEFDEKTRVKTHRRMLRGSVRLTETLPIKKGKIASNWQVAGDDWRLDGLDETHITIKRHADKLQEIVSRTHGVTLTASHYEDGSAQRLQIGPFPKIDIHYDQNTGLGSGVLGDIRVRNALLDSGVTRVTIERR